MKTFAALGRRRRNRRSQTQKTATRRHRSCRQKSTSCRINSTMPSANTARLRLIFAEKNTRLRTKWITGYRSMTKIWERDRTSTRRSTWSTLRRRSSWRSLRSGSPPWRRSTRLSWRSVAWPGTRGSVPRESSPSWSSRPPPSRRSGAPTRCARPSRPRTRRRVARRSRPRPRSRLGVQAAG